MDKGIFKTAGMQRAQARDNMAAKGRQFGIGNFYAWLMDKYPKLTLAQVQAKMPSLEREYGQEKAMRKAEPDMQPSVNSAFDDRDEELKAKGIKESEIARMQKLAGITIEEKVGKTPGFYSLSKENPDKEYNIFADGDVGTTKDGHNYRAVADDQDYSQYLKVIYGDGKYFRIYYDDRVTGGKAGGYDPRGVETNDPRAKKVFADLPDNFFDKYGSEGEHGIEDIIDMIKSADESIEEDAKLSVGHTDDENGMLSKDLYLIGKNAVELHKMLKELPDSDFPHWWQSKIIKSKEYIEGAKNYLEAELSDKEAVVSPDMKDDDPSGVS